MDADTDVNSHKDKSVFSKKHLLRFGAVIAQVVLVALLFKAVRLGSEAFHQLVILAVIGFPVNHLLPLRFRLPFFAALSVVGIFITVGTLSAVWLIGVGLVLIGCCHVPAPMKVRLGLVALVAGILAVCRAGWVEAPWPGGIWPILGAMFMFRLIVYIYDLSHASAPFSPARALAYFFMIPNVCFPLFPVVDYQTFCKTHYNEDPFRIYQTGIKWMVRGAIQLIIYRFIYMFMIVGPGEIEGAAGFFQHMVATFLLYLQVSGLFHTIIGFLHLFGFNLPETNHHWVLASSFTDLWRRINIYWKDFIMKIFYYPLYFQLRKLGNTKAMVLATMVAFFATWALHAYQWFWIRGAALFTKPDIIFWIILGILVTVSVWNEARPHKKIVPKTTADCAKLAVVLALKTTATFLTITFLWSLWTSESLAEWQATLLQWRYWSWDAVFKIVVVLGTLAIAAIVVGRDQWMVGGAAAARARKAKSFHFWKSAIGNGVVGSFVLMMALSEVQSYMNPQLVAVLNVIEKPRLNTHDAAEMQRGYYEDLIQVDRFNSELQAMYQKKPANYYAQWNKMMLRPREGFLGNELRPSTAFTHEGVTYTTNEWGMRDRAYPKEKPEGTYRIGIIGSSHMMGWGVSDNETSVNIAEARLIEEGRPFELLNFSVNGYNTIQKAMVFDEKVTDFDIDAAFLTGHRNEKRWIVKHLVKYVENGAEIPHEFIREVVAKAGVDQSTDAGASKIRLSPYGTELLQWAFQQFIETCHAKGIKAVFVLMPEPGWESSSDVDITELYSLAKDADFDLIVDYTEAYDGYAEKALWIADYDDHPNAKAHQLLSKMLYNTIIEINTDFP